MPCRPWRVPLLLSLLAFGACSDATAVTIAVHYDGPVPEGAHLVLNTSRSMGGRDEQEKTNPTFPETLVILPADGSSGAVEAEAQLTIDGMIFVDMGTAEFVDGENTVLNLYLGNSRPDAGPPREDAGASDASPPTEDASAPDDAGPPIPEVDAGPPVPEVDAGPAGPAECRSLQTAGMPITAIAIASLTAFGKEFIATSGSDSIVRIFERNAATRECFTESDRTGGQADALHLSRAEDGALLLGTGTDSWAYTVTRDGELTARQELPGSFEGILGGPLPRASVQHFALGQRLQGADVHIRPLAPAEDGAWSSFGEVRNHRALDTFGSYAVVQHNTSVMLWTIDVTGSPGDPAAFEREPAVIVDNTFDAAAMIGPNEVILANQIHRAFVQRCVREPMNWECHSRGLPGATGSTPDLLLDGGDGHWTIVRYQGSSVTAYHSTMIQHGLPELPTAIASLSRGLAYINGEGHVIIVPTP